MPKSSLPRVSGLYAVTPPSLGPSTLLARVEQALCGGAQLVQLRAKNWTTEQIERTAFAMRETTRRHRAIFIVNDDIDLARRIGADGVHLGLSDATWEEVREIARENLLVGVSCYNDLNRARLAQSAGAGYVAFGSMFASRTKPDAVRATLDLLRSARSVLTIPIVAIGGIEPDTAVRVVEAGADAVAVISGLFDAPDVGVAAQNYVRAFPSKSEFFESTT